MDPKRRNKAWIRWLEGRNLEHTEVTELTHEMEAKETLAGQLWSDLDIHRQLKAAQKLEADDFTFVGRMMARFEVERTPQLDSTPVPESESLFSSDAPVLDLEAMSIEAPPQALTVGLPERNREHEDQGTFRISAVQSSRPGAKKTTIRMFALAACFLLMASMLWFAYEMGRSNGPAPVAGKQSDTPADISTEVVGKDEIPTPPDLKPLGDDLANRDGRSAADANKIISPDKAVEPSVPADAIANQKPVETLKTLNEQPGLKVAPNTFAKIIEAQTATWAKRPKDWPRVSDQPLELQSGTVTFELDQGGEFTVTGPAQFSIGEQGVDFQTGQAAFVIPDLGDETFVVNARNNQIQPAGVTRFQLNVDDNNSDLKVDRGALEVNPWFGRMVTKPMELNANKRNRLTIEGHDGGQPAVARLSGEQDQFEGWINFQDRVLKSTDAELVDDVFRRAKKRYSESPQRLGQEWKNLTDLSTDQLMQRPGRMGNPQMQNSPQSEQMMKQMREMIEQMQQQAQEAARNGRQGGFNFNFDGQDFQFQKQGDFKSMEKQLLGPFADLAERLKRGQ